MRIPLFLSVIFLLVLYSCTPVAECEIRKEYIIRVSSDVYDTYALFVDGEYVQDIPSISFVELAVSEGYHEIFLEQIEGFRSQPNTEVYDVHGTSCDYVEIIFPD